MNSEISFFCTSILLVGGHLTIVRGVAAAAVLVHIGLGIVRTTVPFSCPQPFEEVSMCDLTHGNLAVLGFRGRIPLFPL